MFHSLPLGVGPSLLTFDLGPLLDTAQWMIKELFSNQRVTLSLLASLNVVEFHAAHASAEFTECPVVRGKMIEDVGRDFRNSGRVIFINEWRWKMPGNAPGSHHTNPMEPVRHNGKGYGFEKLRVLVEEKVVTETLA